MKKLAIILIIGLFALNTNGQSSINGYTYRAKTFDFQSLLDFKSSNSSVKKETLKELGFYKVNNGVFNTVEAVDSICEVWISKDSTEEVRFNNESSEYNWRHNDLIITSKPNRVFKAKGVSYIMLHGTEDYYRFNRKFRIIEDMDTGLIAFTHIKKHDHYVKYWLGTNTVFIGQINE